MGGFVRLVSGIMTGALMAMAIVGGAIFLLNYQYNAAGPLTEARAVTIRKGEGRLQIARKLEDTGIVQSRQLFVINHFARNIVRWFNGRSWRDLKAGEYEFKAGASMRLVLETIAKGRTVLYSITIPEGLTSQHIVKRIMDVSDLTGSVAQVPPEGALLPDTYHFSKGSAREDVLKRMAEQQKKTLLKLWEKRAPDLPLATMDEAVILASIVEKETGHNSERPKVAAVFLNRLRKGMKLQSDPTIIYGLAGGKGSLGRPLYRADIKKKTPYNTYHIKGLPPTPICNPGRAAIEAVLQPAQTDDLYFVADGSGGHKFSKTLKQHNAAVANWRVIEKQARTRAIAKAKAKKAEGVTGAGKAKAKKANGKDSKTQQPAGKSAAKSKTSSPVVINGEVAAATHVSGPKEGLPIAGNTSGAGAATVLETGAALAATGPKVLRNIPLPVRKPK